MLKFIPSLKIYLEPSYQEAYQLSRRTIQSEELRGDGLGAGKEVANTGPEQRAQYCPLAPGNLATLKR